MTRDTAADLMLFIALLSAGVGILMLGSDNSHTKEQVKALVELVDIQDGRITELESAVGKLSYNRAGMRVPAKYEVGDEK